MPIQSRKPNSVVEIAIELHCFTILQFATLGYSQARLHLITNATFPLNVASLNLLSASGAGNSRNKHK
jgi:hypothetical protein